MGRSGRNLASALPETRGVLLGCAVVLSNGCLAHFDAPFNRMAAPRAKLWYPCHEASRTVFGDSHVIDLVAYDGQTRERSEVAVLVIPWLGPFYAQPGAHLAHWDLRARTLDGRSLSSECSKEGTQPNECLRLALLPGSRVITLSVEAKASGSAMDATYVKGARTDGTVAFSARAGGLYSAQVCTLREGDKVMFWVRDEASLTCVSAGCPPADDLQAPVG
jgi:hypothetical protein